MVKSMLIAWSDENNRIRFVFVIIASYEAEVTSKATVNLIVCDIYTQVR